MMWLGCSVTLKPKSILKSYNVSLCSFDRDGPGRRNSRWIDSTGKNDDT